MRWRSACSIFGGWGRGLAPLRPGEGVLVRGSQTGGCCRAGAEWTQAFPVQLCRSHMALLHDDSMSPRAVPGGGPAGKGRGEGLQVPVWLTMPLHRCGWLRACVCVCLLVLCPASLMTWMRSWKLLALQAQRRLWMNRRGLVRLSRFSVAGAAVPSQVGLLLSRLLLWPLTWTFSLALLSSSSSSPRPGPQPCGSLCDRPSQSGPGHPGGFHSQAAGPWGPGCLPTGPRAA